jgi:hypothetical protein
MAAACPAACGHALHRPLSTRSSPCGFAGAPRAAREGGAGGLACGFAGTPRAAREGGAGAGAPRMTREGGADRPVCGFTDALAHGLVPTQWSSCPPLPPSHPPTRVRLTLALQPSWLLPVLGLGVLYESAGHMANRPSRRVPSFPSHVGPCRLGDGGQRTEDRRRGDGGTRESPRGRERERERRG